MIICAGASESFKFAKPIGIGLIEASINLTEFLCENSKNLPNEIIFIGSAGLYKEGEILEIYESSRAGNLEISSFENKSYSPINCEILSSVSRGTLKVNSSNFITTDENLAHKLFAQGYTLENMEFYAILAVARKFKIPAYGIFVATNFCNESAHADFIKNHESAKEKLTEYLKTKGLI